MSKAPRFPPEPPTTERERGKLAERVGFELCQPLLDETVARSSNEAG